jgi:serine/threonine protein kinase
MRVAEAARAALPAAHTPCISDHRLLVPIASGAYGEVWLARNAVGTLRAVKIVRRDQHATEESFDREFKGLQKFEPVSRSHEGLVDILTLGLLPDDAGFYYVMELADAAKMTNAEIRNPKEDLKPNGETTNPQSTLPASGLGLPSSFDICHSDFYTPRTLRAKLKSRGALAASEVVALGLKLTAALAHLHAHGLVHRDVKPSNILFIGGSPKLADAGLVAAVDDARSLVGTAGYIAPEGPGTPRADLYALGKVLYEAAFGKDRQEFPALPNDVTSRPDHARLLELNLILLKACATDGRERYQSAEMMHAELLLLQSGRSVKRRRTVDRCLVVFKKAFLVTVLLAGVLGGTRFVYTAFRPTEYLPKLSLNNEATDLYNMGRHSYQRNTGPALRQAIDYFQKALEKDPNFALAHAALASSYCWGLEDFDVDFEKARQHAARALALDEKLAEAHKVMAWVKYQVDWDWPGSEKEFRRALELAPNDATVHEWYGVYLSGMARFDDSIREIKKAEKLDGVSQSIRMLLGISYLNVHKDELAIGELQKVIDLETNAPSVAYLRLADLYEWRGEFPRAIELRERWSRLAGREDGASVSPKYDELRAAYANEGPPGYWQQRIEWAKRDNDLYLLPSLYAQIGDANGAFAALQHEFERHASSLAAGVMNDRALDSLRSDPRFARLLQDMKLK